MDLQAATSSVAITEQEFNLLRDFIYDKFGINLTDKKKVLLVSRLQAELARLQMNSFQKYYEYLKKSKDAQVLVKLGNLVSTNLTYFNREVDHFEVFTGKILPDIEQKLRAAKSNDIRIWCAGCSTGEEPYMLLMLMKEYFGARYKDYSGGILATDISTKVLTVASKGIYSEDKIEAIQPSLRDKYFKKIGLGQYQVVDSLRKEVSFGRFNLMEAIPFKKRFQVIFCRNVMIYFDQETRAGLVKRFADKTDPGGYLFVGHSEMLSKANGFYEHISPAAYQKIGD